MGLGEEDLCRKPHQVWGPQGGGGMNQVKVRGNSSSKGPEVRERAGHWSCLEKLGGRQWSWGGDRRRNRKQ